MTGVATVKMENLGFFRILIIRFSCQMSARKNLVSEAGNTWGQIITLSTATLVAAFCCLSAFLGGMTVDR